VINGGCFYPRQKPERNGYVRIGRGGKGKERMAHRLAYEAAYGPIPPGYTIDHECHNEDETCPGGPACRHRACINPEHLSAKPSGENTLASSRSTAGALARRECCENDHLYTEANTYWWSGMRQCRMCKLLDHQRRFAERKAIEWGLRSLSDVGKIK